MTQEGFSGFFESLSSLKSAAPVVVRQLSLGSHDERLQTHNFSAPTCLAGFLSRSAAVQPNCESLDAHEQQQPGLHSFWAHLYTSDSEAAP